MSEGKKYGIGYTTGVFDMFHIGHLNILRRAKEQCDYLIVGVSTDEVALEYKHRKPMIPFDERIEIVKAIRYVDEAVPQTTMDKVAAWEKLRFDAMFHGSDWKGTELYSDYEKKFREINVQMVFLPYTEGTSSTGLLQKLGNCRDAG